MANELSKETRPVVLRKLGINETYQQAMYVLNQYRGTVLSCRYRIPSYLTLVDTRVQLQQTFKMAVCATILKHPMLQVAMIDAQSKTPSWIQLISLDLSQHIKWRYIENDDPHEILQQPKDDDFEQMVQGMIRYQLDEFFPDTSLKQPQWKITVVRERDDPIMEVMLTWNHPHFDGMGAKVIQEDLLAALNELGDSVSQRPPLDNDIFQLPEHPPMLPEPLENLRSLPVSVPILIKALWEELRPRFLERDPSLAHWCLIKLTPYGTQYRAFSIDNASLRKILALCRENNTTITGLLHGLALVSFSSRLGVKQASAFQASTIVDHHPSLPEAPSGAPWGSSDKAVANYVTQCLHTVNTKQVAHVRSTLPSDRNSRNGSNITEPMSAETQRELWTAAAKARTDIVQKLKDPLRNDIVGLFKWVTDWQKTMSGIVQRTRQFSWLVTNLGVLNGDSSTRTERTAILDLASRGSNSDENQPWSIERAQFALSAEMHAAVIEIAPVSVAGHGMVIGFIWPKCAVEKKFAEGIVADFETWLLQLAKES